jgi:hypothetical protein
MSTTETIIKTVLEIEKPQRIDDIKKLKKWVVLKQKIVVF